MKEYNIKELDDTLWNDLVILFKTDSQCSDCWCMNHRLSPEKVVTGETAKKELKLQIEQKMIYGLLAFDKNVCIGWCAVDPVTTQVGHDYVLESKSMSNSSWMIHCLYIHPNYRSKGISKLLISSAVDLAKKNGAKSLLSFPIPEENQNKFPKDEAEFSGRFSTYKKLGFEKKDRLSEFYEVMELNC